MALKGRLACFFFWGGDGTWIFLGYDIGGAMNGAVGVI